VKAYLIHFIQITKKLLLRKIIPTKRTLIFLKDLKLTLIHNV
jgi:hypothetical protein